MVGSWWRRFVGRGSLEVLLWLIIVVSWAYLLIRSDWNLLQITVWSVPFLLVITAATTPWRSIRWKTALGFFLLGFGPVFLLVVLVVWLTDVTGLERAMGTWLDSTTIGVRRLNVLRDVVAPVTEEFAKVLPLLVAFWWRSSGLRTSAGPVDYAVLAGATGAGLGFAENIFVYLTHGLEGPTSSVFALGLGPTYANIVGVNQPSFVFGGRTRFSDTVAFLLPEMKSHLGYIWPGHGGLAMGIGLSLGLAVWWSRRRGSKLFYLIPLAVYLFATVQHTLYNWQGGAACDRSDWLLCPGVPLTLNGRLFPILLLAGLGYAIWISGGHLREHRKNDPALTLSKESIARSAYTSNGWRGWITLVSDRFTFHRFRRKTGYGAFHLQRRKITTLQELTLRTNRAETLILKEKLQGDPPTEIPQEVRTLMDQVASLP